MSISALVEVKLGGVAVVIAVVTKNMTEPRSVIKLVWRVDK